MLVIGSLAGGGAERVFLTLLRHLNRNHFEPHLIVLEAKGEFACEVPRDVVVHSLNGDRHRRSLPGLCYLMWAFVRLLWNIRPRAVLSTGRINLALALARPFLPRGTKLLIRECSVLSARLESDTRFPNIWRWLYRRLYRWADKVVCLSDFMVRDMTDHFNLPQDRPIRIYNPIDLDLVRELGTSGGNPYSGAGPQLVAAGRLSSEKGFDLLLAAMPRVLEWPYLSHADLFVLPSRREAFSNTLLEALALKTPAVAIDCPGAIREIYGSHPEVRLVPAGDCLLLAEAIIDRCKTARRERTSQNTSRDWLAKFALHRIIGEYSALFLG